MEEEIGIRPDIYGKLRFETVSGIKRLQFLLLEYCFFKDSEGTALSLGLPWPFSPLSLVIHIIKTRALTLFRLPCYFIKLETETIGLLAFQELHESLHIASLGIAKKHRRLRIGKLTLSYIGIIAECLNKRWLEVDVWKKNVPARQFYARYGFKLVKSEKMLFKMRKETGVKTVKIAETA